MSQSGSTPEKYRVGAPPLQLLPLRTTSIDVLRIGFSEMSLPFPVVISITVDWDLDPHDWLLSKMAILDILRTNNPPKIQVSFEREDRRNRQGLYWPGDSGSMVINRGSEWVGLAFGGPKKTNVVVEELVYVTDARVLFEHMRELSGNEYEFSLA
ncbi:hypothetical protein MMC14_004451 [Varicellaria rhodocarpa]|nr:hypothetical protein [Varicellaria rhodocarpa]